MSIISKLLAGFVILLIMVVVGLNLYLSYKLSPEIRDCIEYTGYSREECELSNGITSEQ